MAIPSEYKDFYKVQHTDPADGTAKYSEIGGTNATHPVITFRVLMARPSEEVIGPKTNQKTVAVLHPDRHDSSADRGRVNAAAHVTRTEAWLPGLLGAMNINLRDDGTFIASGAQATYLKQQYVDIANPLLEVVS